VADQDWLGAALGSAGAVAVGILAWLGARVATKPVADSAAVAGFRELLEATRQALADTRKVLEETRAERDALRRLLEQERRELLHLRVIISGLERLLLKHGIVTTPFAEPMLSQDGLNERD